MIPSSAPQPRYDALMSDDRDQEARERARQRALRAAMAVTLGVSLAGCAQVNEVYCSVFETRYCCEDVEGGTWNASTRSCVHAMPVPGPFVPPA